MASSKGTMAALLLAVLALAGSSAGCDTSPETSSERTGGGETEERVGGSVSELDDSGASEEEASDDGAEDENVAVGDPAHGAPFDHRAEPDPIPWSPKENHSTDT